jgi:hypothetical protein
VSLIAELVHDLEAALARLKPSTRALRTLRGALAHLNTITLTAPEGLGLKVDTAGAGEGAIARDLCELFVQLGGAAHSRGSGVVFLLDEVQFVDQVEYRALISALHRATQKGLPITAAAAGLPQIPRLTGEARSYGERLFSFPVIANLPADDARLALVEPARQREVAYEKGAIARALSWTGGYPFYIQQLGKHAWNLARASPITRPDVDAAIPRAQAALDASIYEVRIQRATVEERRYLRAMAELGEGPYRSGEVATMLGRTTPAVSMTRARLIEKGLVYATEDYGHVDYTVPRFGEFLRRHLDFGKGFITRRRSTDESQDRRAIAAARRR